MAIEGRHRNVVLEISLFARIAILALAIMHAFGIVLTQSAQAQTYTVIHTFTGGTDGAPLRWSDN